MPDTFRKQKIVFSAEDAALVDSIKTKAEELMSILPQTGKESSIAISRLEEFVMWAVKGITSKYYESNSTNQAQNHYY